MSALEEAAPTMRAPVRLQPAGIRFYTADDNEFVLTGGTLKDVKRIDVSGFCRELKDIEIITMCIDNPFIVTMAQRMFS